MTRRTGLFMLMWWKVVSGARAKAWDGQGWWSTSTPPPAPVGSAALITGATTSAGKPFGPRLPSVPTPGSGVVARPPHRHWQDLAGPWRGRLPAGLALPCPQTRSLLFTSLMRTVKTKYHSDVLKNKPDAQVHARGNPAAPPHLPGDRVLGFMSACEPVGCYGKSLYNTKKPP